ncbi:aldehyde dehydrogenase family protein [Alloalcanivorax sp. C16-2]|uniref:aldehyde dehydrogenase family protein n=1 Tax=Alloalcanivorax TaxID=3020832 RepID=UPI0019316CA5|nr:aldehyde dehydrogenase family protein [Alloalcanivorax marinus]MBL7249901.1 aldehyde dehydrogenase family protein [Alloalcanivorax marinus]
MPNDRYDCFIGGDWTAAASGEYLDVLDPANGLRLAEIARGGAQEVDAAVASARSALPGWCERPPVERSRILSAIARRLLAEQDRLAHLESRDTGKPLFQARADAVAAARFFEYYAGAADKVLGDAIPMGPEYVDFTVREPMGVTAQIVPWNYPLQIACRGLAPALATGNTVVMKPAELACLSVLEVARICQEEGLPAGVLNIVTGLGQEAGAALASHPDINLAVFTGSVQTGRLVMKSAAENIVPVLLELGGKSPNVLLPDTDLESAVPTLIKAAFPHAGQTCSAATRVVVHRGQHAELVARLAEAIAELTVGPGLEDPSIGALVSQDQKQKVTDYIRIAEEEGARVISGGRALPGARLENGNFVMPTLLDNVKPGMRVHQEEIFGPVLAVVPYDDVEEAVTIANGTEYGLVAGVWGADVKATHRLASRLRAGQVFVNCYGAGGGVELPFGGYGKSGFGREKGMDALLAYTQVKNVCVRIAG